MTLFVMGGATVLIWGIMRYAAKVRDRRLAKQTQRAALARLASIKVHPAACRSVPSGPRHIRIVEPSEKLRKPAESY